MKRQKVEKVTWTVGPSMPMWQGVPGCEAPSPRRTPTGIPPSVNRRGTAAQQEAKPLPSDAMHRQASCQDQKQVPQDMMHKLWVTGIGSNIGSRKPDNISPSLPLMPTIMKGELSFCSHARFPRLTSGSTNSCHIFGPRSSLYSFSYGHQAASECSRRMHYLLYFVFYQINSILKY